MIEQNNDVTASALEYFRRKQQWHDEADMREAAMYDDIAAQSARHDAADAWIKSQAAGDTLPGRDQFDYAQMLADGVTPGRDDTGAIPLPPRYFRGVYAGGVDLGTRGRILDDAPQIEDEFEAAVLALDDPETDPRVRRSVAAWLKSQGVEGVDEEPNEIGFTGERVNVAANGPAVTGLLQRQPEPDSTAWQATKHGTIGLPMQILEMLIGLDSDAKPAADKIEALRKQWLGKDPYDEDVMNAMLNDPTLLAGLSALAKPTTWQKLFKAMRRVSKPAAVAGGAAAMGTSEDAEAGLVDALMKAGVKVPVHTIKDAASMNRFALALKDGHPEAVDAFGKLNAAGKLMQFDAGGVSGFVIDGAGFRHGVNGHLQEAIAWSKGDPSRFSVGISREGELTYGVLNNGVVAVFDRDKKLITFKPASRRVLDDYALKNKNPR